MVSPTQLELLNLIAPIFFGIILSIVGVYNRFGPDFIKALKSYSGVFYLALSASGALLFAQVMEVSGVNVLNDLLLNSVIINLLSAGLFLGLLSRIAIKGESSGKDSSNGANRIAANGEISEKFADIKTLSDYIYNALNDSMTRKVDSVKRRAIITILSEYDIKEILFNPRPNSTKGLVSQLIDINSYMTESDKLDLYLKIDKCVEDGNYARIFSELTDIKTNITINEIEGIIKSSNTSKRTSQIINEISQVEQGHSTEQPKNCNFPGS